MNKAFPKRIWKVDEAHNDSYNRVREYKFLYKIPNLPQALYQSVFNQYHEIVYGVEIEKEIDWYLSEREALEFVINELKKELKVQKEQLQRIL